MPKNLFARISASVAVLALTAGSAMATTDYTAITSAVDFSDTKAAVLSVAVAVVGLYLAIRGAKTVLRMIRGL